MTLFLLATQSSLLSIIFAGEADGSPRQSRPYLFFFVLKRQLGWILCKKFTENPANS